jgi:hypothetical protein
LGINRMKIGRRREGRERGERRGKTEEEEG